MPEIKHTFLKGKMNKSLDDRLVPEGEYRDAQNIEVTTDIEGGGDIGTVRRVKGNTALNSADNYFTGTAETIGSFFDDKNNTVYYFVTDGSKHKIYRYKVNTAETTTIARGSYLNFSKDYLITGINILDNFLFWTDDLNPPRRINLDKLTTTDYYFDLTDEIKVSVAKYSPFQAPSITMERSATNNNHIEEKFVRFSYRYKYDDGTYSQLAPFSPIAFELENSQLTADQVKKAYEQGLIDSFVNHINKVTITAQLPSNPINEYGISSVEFLMKDDNSASVRIIKKIDVTDNNATGVIHDYQSEIPVATLPEKELLRVSENAPIKAKSQEIVGNRLVYGNFVENYNVPSLNYTLDVSNKTSGSATAASVLYPHHSVKQRRTYEVGVVLSDKYGRKSPVILGDNPTIYVPAKGDFDSKDWPGDSLKITFSSLPSNWNEWYSYRIVVKQTQQEYYNVYLPGLSSFNGITYFTTFGDNVNKIPRDSEAISFESEISSSNTYVYPKVINGKFYTGHVENTSNVTLNRTEYQVNINSGNSIEWAYWCADDDQYVVSEITNIADQEITIPGGAPIGGLTPTVRNVQVYVDGMLAQKNKHYTTTGENATPPNITSITFTSEYAQPVGRKITIFKELYFQGQGGTGGGHVFKALYYPTGYLGDGSGWIERDRDNFNIYVYTGDGITLQYPVTNGPDVYQTMSDAGLVKIQGIGTLSSFNEIGDNFVQTSDEENGFYKAKNNYLIASIADEIGLQLTGDNLIVTGKQHDLAVLETKPFESAIDIYYETPTSGLVSSLAAGTEIEIDYYNTFIVKGDTPPNVTDAIWHVEESRIRGDFNADSVGYGVVAHATNSDYEQTRRENTLIYSGIYNPRTGFNETNQFPQGENITKSLDLQQGSIQKLFAEESDLIVFQEERVSNIPIDRDIIYTAEGMPQVVTSNRVLGDPMAYLGNYGIGKNPESFAYYAGRKYFVDKPKGAVLRLSRDGITEISNYGMRTYFVNQFSTPSDVTVYNDNIFGMWDMAKRQYVLHIGKNYISNVEATVFPEETTFVEIILGDSWWLRPVYATDANGSNQTVDRPEGDSYVGIYKHYYIPGETSNLLSQDDLPIPLSDPLWQDDPVFQFLGEFNTIVTYGGNDAIYVYDYNNVIYAEDADGNNQSLTRGDRNFYYVNVTSDAAMEESDLPIGTGTWTAIVDAAVAVDESVTLSYDESAQGWVSFYDFNPQTGGSIDGKFYTFKESQIYEHHKGIGFYGDASLTASVDLVMNQNPSASKNFLTINYEGTNTWNINTIETDTDTANSIIAYDNTKQDTNTDMYLNIFRNFDGKYFANIINNSPVNDNEVSFGGDISGVKGHFLKLRAYTSDASAELFSISTNYNINSY